MSRPVALRIPPDLMAVVTLKARLDRTDLSTALRQILYEGAEDYVLALLHRGRVGLSWAAELLGVDPWEVHRLAGEKGIPLGATAAQHDRALRTAREKL